MTPEMIVALTTGLATLATAIGANYISYQKLKIEFKDKTHEQTQVIAARTEAQTATLTKNAAEVATVVATKLEQTEAVHRLEIKASNNFNVKIAKLEGQQEIMTRYLNALLHATGIEVKKEESC